MLHSKLHARLLWVSTFGGMEWRNGIVEYWNGGMLHRTYRAVESSPRVGRLMDQSGDAAKGSKIEVCSADHSAQSAEKNFRLHFQLSGWAFMALSYFED